MQPSGREAIGGTPEPSMYRIGVDPGISNQHGMLIGYARVSTDEQNLDLQIGALERCGCEKIFQDHGISGKNSRRPGLDQACAMLGEGDTLVVWRLDRLGRSLSHLIQTVTEFEAHGVHFRSLTEHIDTGSAGGRLVFHIMGAMAEFEHSLISERTRAGMKVAQQRGARIGRPAVLTAEQRDQAVDSLKKGQSMTAVAIRFGVSETTIRRLCRRN